jgi:hypothetical protein
MALAVSPPTALALRPPEVADPFAVVGWAKLHRPCALLFVSAYRQPQQQILRDPTKTAGRRALQALHSEKFQRLHTLLF